MHYLLKIDTLIALLYSYLNRIFYNLYSFVSIVIRLSACILIFIIEGLRMNVKIGVKVRGFGVSGGGLCRGVLMVICRSCIFRRGSPSSQFIREFGYQVIVRLYVLLLILWHFYHRFSHKCPVDDDTETGLQPDDKGTTQKQVWRVRPQADYNSFQLSFTSFRYACSQTWPNWSFATLNYIK